MSDKINISIQSILLAPKDADVSKVKKELQQKIGNLSVNTKPIQILNKKEIDDYVQKWNNSISRLKINKDKVFADSRVTEELNKMKLAMDGFTKGTVGLKDVNLQMDNLRTRVAEVSGSFKNVNRDGYAFTEMLTLAAKKIAIWGISTSLVYGTFRQFKEAVTYVADLDNSLNEIRIVTGKTQEEVNALAKSYNELAKEMSVTTKELTGTSADLYRQGLTEEEVNARMRAIVQYAKISSISLDQSNKIITATANATKESVEDIIDIFAYLGDATAAGADEIGEALQRVASASENSGLSLAKTASWISTISSVTRESASTIGRSLNSLISRYEQIRERGFTEEDSTRINDVSKALASVGIIATDAYGQLKPIADIVDELGSRWEYLEKNEKSYIATTLGGTYQRNRLITLLNNYTDSMKSYEEALNAAGIAQQKFDIYQESSQAKLDTFRASWEELYMVSINSNAFKVILDGATELVNGLSDLIGKFQEFQFLFETFNPYGVKDVDQRKIKNALSAFNTTPSEDKQRLDANLKRLRDLTDYDNKIMELRKYETELASLDPQKFENYNRIPQLQGFINKIKAQIAPYEEALAKYQYKIFDSNDADAMSALRLKNFGGSGSSGGTTSGDTPPVPYQSKLDEYINSLQLISEKESEITSVQKERNLLNESESIPLLNKEISLQKDLITLNEQLLSQQKQTRQSLADQLSAYSGIVTVASDLETLNVDTQKYNQLTDTQKQNLDDLITKFTNLNKSIISSKNSIQDSTIAVKNLQDSIVKLQETSIKTTLKSITDSISSQIKALQKEQESVIESMEDSLKRYEERQQTKIDKLKEELELLEEQNEEEDRRLELAKLQEQITNTLNNKNVRTLKRQADGTWDYVYTYDEEKYSELITQREELLNEYKRKDIIKAKQDEIKALEDATRKEIQRQRDEIAATKRNYEQRISDYTNFKDKLSELQNQTLEEMKNSFNSIIEELKSFTSIWNEYADKLKPINAKINMGTVSGSVGGGSSSSGGSNSYTDSSGNTHYTGGNTSDSRYEDNSHLSRDQVDAVNDARDILKDAGLFHTGLDVGKFVGNIPFDPKTETIAKLLKGEIVMTQPQFNNIIPNMIKGLNFPGKNPVQQIFQIDNISLPSVTDGKSFIKAIKNDLPRLALQSART